MTSNHKNTKADLISSTKLALRRLASSVTVITSYHDGQRLAMAATAVDALSMEPPSLLVCINQTASMHMALSLGTVFCINILHRSQEKIAQLCGGGANGEERFSIGTWHTAAENVPYLEGAQANIMCTVDAAFAYGTHGIFVGKVQQVTVSESIDPLLYMNGRYLGAGA